MSHSEDLLIAYERATGYMATDDMWNMPLDELIDMFEQVNISY